MSQTKGPAPVYTWKRVFSKKEFRNQDPGARAGHAQFLLLPNDNRFWVHGGQCEGGTYSSELFCFDTVKKIWSKHNLQNEPSARAYHGVCLCTPTTEMLIEKGKKAVPRVLLYGGIEKGHLKKEVSVLEQWPAFTSRSNFFSAKSTAAWQHDDDEDAAFTVGGSIPMPRCNHSATTLHTGQHVLIFGGWHGRFVSDVYVLNTDLMDWSLKKCKSNPRANMEFQVTPRAGHAAVLVRAQQFDRGDSGTFQGPALVCFGGQTDGGMQLDELLVLDLTHWEWHKPRPSGREPVARSGHSAVLVGSDRIVFFGGWDGGKVRDDVHVLQIAGDMYQDWCWQEQTVKGVKVEGRIGHGAVYTNGSMFIYGGVGRDQKLLEDTNVLHIPDVVVDHSRLSTADEAEMAAMAAAQEQSMIARVNRNQVLSERDQAATLDDKLDEAVQAVSRRILTVKAQQREHEEAMAATVAQNLREAKQRSVFQLVQHHGKNLGDAMDIANGFNPEDNRLLDPESTARDIVAQFHVPEAPKERREKKSRSENSAWHDAIIGGMEEMALDQIAVNGGLMKTWGALIDDDDSSSDEEVARGGPPSPLALESASASVAQQSPLERAGKYSNNLERELQGASLQQLVQQQTERELAFSQQQNKQNYKSSQKRSDDNVNRRPKRLIEPAAPPGTAGPLALTSGKSLSEELSEIVKQGGALTKYKLAVDFSRAIADTLPQNRDPIPQGILDAATKIKTLFLANMYRKRYKRLRATIRIQSHIRRFINNIKVARLRTLREEEARERALEEEADSERRAAEAKKQAKVDAAAAKVRAKEAKQQAKLDAKRAKEEAKQKKEKNERRALRKKLKAKAAAKEEKRREKERKKEENRLAKAGKGKAKASAGATDYSQPGTSQAPVTAH